MLMIATRSLLRTVPRLALTALLPLATLLATPTVASAAPSPQGLYEECAPSNQQQCAGELAQMGGAGFRLALNYTAWYGSAADIQAYAGEAQAQGIKLIWPLNVSTWRDGSSLTATYTQLAADCGCTTNEAFLQYAVNLVRNLPSTWGFYVGDEVGPSQAPLVAALAAKVRALDPVHPLLYVGSGLSDVGPGLNPFLSAADVIGADVYPVGSGLPVAYVGDVASKVKDIAERGNKRSAMVLQAFSWGQYPTEIQAVGPRWPTEVEMRTMRDQAVLASPAMILWYNLSDIQRSDNPAKHWQDLVAAAFGGTHPAASSSAGQGATSSSTGQGALSSGTGSAGTQRRQESLGGAVRRANGAHIRLHRRNRHRHRTHDA
jgi:hypothetical protein